MHRMNNQIAVFTSAARTATPTAYTGLNESGTGICVNTNITARDVATTLTVTISGIDSNGVSYTLLAGAAVGTGAQTLWIFPASTVAATSANARLPRNYKIAVAHSDANSITYSVSADILR